MPEGLYDPEPEPEEPTRVFQAVTEEGMDDSAAGHASYARAGDYTAADDGTDGPARRSFQDTVLNPLMARLAAMAYRIREHNSAVHASADAEEDLGPEPDAEDAARYYGGQVKSLRFRCRAAMIVCIPLIYISLGLPVFGVLKSSPSVAALVCLMMQLTVMLIGLDVITNGFFSTSCAARRGWNRSCFSTVSFPRSMRSCWLPRGQTPSACRFVPCPRLPWPAACGAR